MRVLLKSKIYNVKVTGCYLHYDSSITIDASLMKQADIFPYEVVQVVNVNNGVRFETYAIRGEPGDIELNGGAARLGVVGDPLIIMSYVFVNDWEIPKEPIIVKGE